MFFCWGVNEERRQDPRDLLFLRGQYTDMINETKFSSSEGNVELLISEDRFSAYLKINENGIISQNEIIQLLEKAGISETLNLSDRK